MSESFRTTDNGYQAFGQKSGQDDRGEDDAGEVGKALLVGLLGGLISAAGYMVYRRLPEEQKEKLHTQVRTVVQQRITELRQNFNI